MQLENVRRWAADWADILVLAAFGSAVFLLLAIVMPDWFARTSWERGSQNRSTTYLDSPVGYVGLVSLCGIIAFVALAVGLWRRWALAAALAAAAFAYGTYVVGSYWLVLSRGEALLDGHARMGSKWTVHSPPALPVFALAAVIGFISALALAVHWLRQPGDT